MKCHVCKKEAVISLRSHNTAFCEECFFAFFRRQLARGIAMTDMLAADDRILVALSGGKDSLALMHALSHAGYAVTALHLDLGIPDSSSKARQCVEDFCNKHAFPLIVVDFAREGLAIPQVKARIRRPICSACGTIKRYFFNKVAMDNGFTALATGHNLDDEVARLMSNTLRWDEAYLAGQSPSLPSEHGFVKKIKPLWRLTEYETAAYAFLKGIHTHYAPCPYSSGASFRVLKKLVRDLEWEMPGRKIDFYQGFLKRGKPAFARLRPPLNEVLSACSQCGYPTSAGELCSVCRIREALKEEK